MLFRKMPKTTLRSKFREEMYYRSFKNLDDVVREAREELKEKMNYSQSVPSFKKKG